MDVRNRANLSVDCERRRRAEEIDIQAELGSIVELWRIGGAMQGVCKKYACLGLNVVTFAWMGSEARQV